MRGIESYRVKTLVGHATLLMVTVGTRDILDPHVALQHNARLQVGSLAHDGLRLVLRHLVPDGADLPAARAQVLQEAARLRVMLRRPPLDPAFYACFAD